VSGLSSAGGKMTQYLVHKLTMLAATGIEKSAQLEKLGTLNSY